MKIETATKHFYMDGTPGATGGGMAAPAAPAPQAPAAAPAAPSIAWLPEADPDTVGYVQNKGWQTQADAVKSYQNLEKLMGADRAGRTVALPPEGAEDIAWHAVYDKLGRPATPEQYKMTVPEGADPAFSKEAAKWFHGAGLNQQQVQTLDKHYNEYQAQIAQREQQALQGELDKEHAELEQDWGAKTTPAYQAQKELAKRALGHFGLDEKAIDALESVAGFKAVMKAFAKIGGGLGEPGDRGMSGGNGGFTMTPEAAKSRKSQLMADSDWAKRAMKSGSAEWAELSKLNQTIAASM